MTHLVLLLLIAVGLAGGIRHLPSSRTRSVAILQADTFIIPMRPPSRALPATPT